MRSPRDKANVAALRRGVLPCEYLEGEWRIPGEGEQWAVVTFSEEPSPETGHAGWVWWALGRMGDAPTYEQARARAEDALKRIEEARGRAQGVDGERDDGAGAR